MPFEEVTKMSLKLEFIKFVLENKLTFSELCQGFGISRKTGYKLLNRYKTEGMAGLEEKSRRPHTSPAQTKPAIEKKVIAVRRSHPSWGCRKIQHYLINKKEKNIPARSTITDILHRHELIHEEASNKIAKWRRFEREAPNEFQKSMIILMQLIKKYAYMELILT